MTSHLPDDRGSRLAISWLPFDARRANLAERSRISLPPHFAPIGFWEIVPSGLPEP